MLDGCPYTHISIFDRSFWDLWLQKIFRNIASVKYQFLVAFYGLVIYGMFDGKEPTISAALGLGFLGGGFITLVTSRLAIRTSLFEGKKDSNGFDTDQ